MRYIKTVLVIAMMVLHAASVAAMAFTMDCDQQTLVYVEANTENCHETGVLAEKSRCNHCNSVCSMVAGQYILPEIIASRINPPGHEKHNLENHIFSPIALGSALPPPKF